LDLNVFWQLSDSIWAIKCGEHRVGKKKRVLYLAIRIDNCQNLWD